MVEPNKIYCCDVLEGLKKLEDNSIDLIVTSPPYNKGYWSVNRNMNNNEFNTKSRCVDYGVYDDIMSPDEYQKWQSSILLECCRVIKPTGSIFYNHKDICRDHLAVHPTYVYRFPIKQTIIWDRGNTPQIDKSYFFPITEWIFWIKKNYTARPYFDRKQAMFDKNIWKINPDKNNDHPAPFPIEIPENCILACTKENDIVLDPFMGSGTTALAAKKHNRNYIGFELNPDFITEANNRLNG